ncbi:LLM class flavin-dependent oxidoreductase [Nocardia sp. NPDC020380]|uniref:LLM class flavin-dependent oxidoreductase n=1 Tax=Nocardia sp. NPDC020380 TaxID=3364309 RepID=UPI00378B8024
MGWSPEEYEAAGIPFRDRGQRLDETLDALEAIWTTNPAEYTGTMVSVPRHHAGLSPVQRPRPPIQLGAFSPAGLARVGRRADGWLPVLLVTGPQQQAFLLQQQHAFLLQQRALVDRAAEAAGRDPGDIETVVRVNVTGGTPLQDVADAVRGLGAETPFDSVFIDLLYVTESADAALGAAVDLLKLLR